MNVATQPVENGIFINLNSMAENCFSGMFINSHKSHNKFVFCLSIFRIPNSPLTGLCAQMLKFSDDKLLSVVKPVHTSVDDFYNSRIGSNACLQ